jgi:hypothetical protein
VALVNGRDAGDGPAGVIDDLAGHVRCDGERGQSGNLSAREVLQLYTVGVEP